jgi:quinol monooxygenase YgiN
VIWHVVRFDFTGVDEDERTEVEADLRALSAIGEVAWLRVGRDLDDPRVTGLLTAFADEAALDTYRTHPDHEPVVERIRALGLATVRLDLATDDAVDALP